MNKLPGDVIKFIRKKEYTFQKKIGQGGTGKTILVKDEVTDINFVCKKYSPYDITNKNQYFNRFIDEIKIMYLLSHPNIVRIYNYFLYPENTTGYILMEHIEGETIDNYLLFQGNDIFEKIFIQLIEGFKYLEKNNVLHRDIRNENILVTNEGIVKIIDFGFGKKIECESKEKASILLNWPVSDFPEEIYNYKYDHQTEVYFVGKLFNKILEMNFIEDFRYQHIIDKMIISNPYKRINSFSQVLECLSQDIFQEIDFTDTEKSIYVSFTDKLISHMNFMIDKFIPVTEPEEVVNSLEKVIKDSLIEDILQDNSRLIACFINNDYNYTTSKDINVKIIRDFYSFFKKLTKTKQKIVLSNINTRLKVVKIKYNDDEIPF
ncbi:protein kinase family protein [Clostridium ganghwense]|uniref:non-specific serine/threonine protein kinase n=1 Tax=Clostridium ganghwense TaxID=312089 RepID=A0ABT4CR09_9CLOT|nr:protein kinase family protein [Clostridium ganghwense]MCY6370661.1 protein kinase family protein [Clostridium ganghwense]